MKDVLEALLANDLRDLAGSRAQVSVSITDRLANQAAAALLAQLGAAGGSSRATPPGAGPAFDLPALLAHLRRLQVAFHEGRAVVEVEAAVE